jgi:DNA-binding PadR family transcriptional regulator
MRHFGSHCEDRHAAGRHGRWGRHHRHGGRHGRDSGFDGGDMMRAGRMLAQGDLRLLALALLAEQPRHGYEIIKLLEDKTAGWYSPSPGIVYPTLTYLEEVGYLTAQPEGAKRLYTITAEGRAHLEENRDFVDAVLERLGAMGERVTRMRRRAQSEEDERRGPSVSPMVRAAIENLREIAAKRLEDDADAEAKVVEILVAAASQLRRS